MLGSIHWAVLLCQFRAEASGLHAGSGGVLPVALDGHETADASLKRMRGTADAGCNAGRVLRGTRAPMLPA
jgi:hypothetical protein